MICVVPTIGRTSCSHACEGPACGARPVGTATLVCLLVVMCMAGSVRGASPADNGGSRDNRFRIHGSIICTQYGLKDQADTRAERYFEGEFAGPMWWITTAVKTKQQVLNPAMRAVIERRSRQRPNGQ